MPADPAVPARVRAWCRLGGLAGLVGLAVGLAGAFTALLIGAAAPADVLALATPAAAGLAWSLGMARRERRRLDLVRAGRVVWAERLQVALPGARPYIRYEFVVGERHYCALVPTRRGGAGNPPREPVLYHPLAPTEALLVRNLAGAHVAGDRVSWR